jgi:hypothetical protein
MERQSKTGAVALLITVVGLALALSIAYANAKPRVFMFEGLGGVLVPRDTGVRAAAKEIARRCPGSVVTVHWHGTNVGRLAQQAARDGHALAFIGHSMGGRAAIREATRIVPTPVAYVGSVDPVRRFLPVIPSNVMLAENWVQAGVAILGGGVPVGSKSTPLAVDHIPMMYDRRVVNRLVQMVCVL